MNWIRNWWLLAVLASGHTLAMGWIWFAGDRMRQQKYIFSLMTIVVSGVLVLGWVAFFSKLRRRTRAAIIGAVVVICVVSRVALRIEDVSGDLLPSITCRWAPPRDTTLTTWIGPGPDDSASDRTAPHVVLPGLRDYPQFLGPDRNATLSGIELALDFSSPRPRLLWRHSIGAGWSSFAVADGRAVTQEQRGPKEMVVCYEVTTGKVQWRHQDHTRYETTIAGVGPRATPTIDSGRVYTLGATGILNCLDLATGQRIWARHILEDNDAQLNEWGMSGSPLVLDEKIVVSAGGPDGRSLVAYDKHTGDRIWSGGDDRASYSSPSVAELAGVRQVVVVNQTTVCGHDAYTGRLLWTYAWPGGHPKVAQPVLLPGDRLFISSSYGAGCELLKVRSDDHGRQSAIRIWKSMRLKAKFTNVVFRDGFIYGLDESILVCLDIETGQRRWKGGRYGHGQLILVDDVLMVQTEWGQIVLVNASPDQHLELTRFQALDGKTWNNPVLAGRYLVVRNHLEAACYELGVQERQSP